MSEVKVNDGGRAFPAVGMSHIGSSQEGVMTVFNPGMTLRDWFAGMALQGISANPDISIAAAKAKLSIPAFRDCCAEGAFEVADAMIRAREKKP